MASWSPDGDKIVFDSGRHDSHGEIYTMNANGTNVVRLTNDPGYDFNAVWSPDGTKIALDSAGARRTMTATGTPLTESNGFPGYAVGWRPDGAMLAYTHSSPNQGTLMMDNPNWNGSSPIGSDDGQYPDWQPLNNSYARPKGGSPMRVPLVPEYKRCLTGNTTHRGAISRPSCYSPTPESSYLTIGSPDYNGVPANSNGSVVFNAVAGDGSITVSLTDVRCRGTSGGCSNGPLSDYSGHLLFATNFRITDKNSGPSGVGLSANATVNDLQLDFPVPCATTTSTSIGSTCSVNTSIDSVLGGSTAIVDGKRAIWQLVGFPTGRVIEVDDGGADGVATTFDNTAFAAGGLFFP